jgi:hypothetical protein
MPEHPFSSVEKLREFLKKNPPQSPDQQVFGSAVLAHLEYRELENRFLMGEIVKLKKILGELLGEDAPKETVGKEVKEQSTKDRDQTPFPAGVSPSGAASTAKTAGEDDEEEETEVIARSGPPTNVQPIPKMHRQGPQPIPQPAQKKGEAAK